MGHHTTRRDRLVLTMAYLYGFTHAEIARRLRTGRPAVTRLIARATERFRNATPTAPHRQPIEDGDLLPPEVHVATMYA
jgi:DNA-directed RNA polymerase specialized sigma24 family protein